MSGTTAKLVVGTTTGLAMEAFDLEYSSCVVGTLIDETHFFGHEGEPLFAKMSVPPLPDADSFMLLEIPRQPWIAGLIQLPLEPTKTDHDFLTAMGFPSLLESYNDLVREEKNFHARK